MSASGHDACDACLRRTDLVAALAGRIEIEWRRRSGVARLLALGDQELVDWAGDAGVARRHAAFDAAAARRRIETAGLVADCRCAPGYPAALLELPDPPAVLHRTGGRGRPGAQAVAIVGARRASAYGLEVAAALGRGLAASGLTVVSGMALGVDSAAHAGALEAGATVAVLAGGADVPYPASKRALHRRIAQAGTVVSEMPPGFPPYRWAFPARNRLIAALSLATVVVEGGERSGSLITADFAGDLGRPVGAVPGQVTAAGSAGPNLLIKSGAELVRGARDVLDLLFGVGAPAAPAAARPDGEPRNGAADLPDRLRRLLERVEGGPASVGDLASSAEEARRVAADLGDLELRGLIRRTFGGRYVRAA